MKLVKVKYNVTRSPAFFAKGGASYVRYFGEVLNQAFEKFCEEASCEDYSIVWRPAVARLERYHRPIAFHIIDDAPIFICRSGSDKNIDGHNSVHLDRKARQQWKEHLGINNVEAKMIMLEGVKYFNFIRFINYEEIIARHKTHRTNTLPSYLNEGW